MTRMTLIFHKTVFECRMHLVEKNYDQEAIHMYIEEMQDSQTFAKIKSEYVKLIFTIFCAIRRDCARSLN